jgi:RNA recognition motif-containing protein
MLAGYPTFCTDEKLSQAFTPFGVVVPAQVLRDEWGHSLGLGVVRMAYSEDVERVFNESTSTLKYRARVWISGSPQSPRIPKPSEVPCGAS